MPEADDRKQGTGELIPVRVAVVGAGAFGRNHLRVYRELQAAGYPVELVAVIEPDDGARAAAVAKFGVRGFATIEQCVAAGLIHPTQGDKTAMDGAPGVLPRTLRDRKAEDGAPAGLIHPTHGDKTAMDGAPGVLHRSTSGAVTAASVCVPTVHHASCARTLMACGINLLIEKPLAASLVEADEIVALAREQGRIVQVGHLERFNPALRALRGLLNRPMFFEVHRLSVFTPRSLDVDVVLDLMIHDLDIVTKLVGEPVREVRAVGLPVLSKKVDIANVRLEFENGCVANFTASRVSTERVRKMRFFQPHQYLSLDFARQDLLLIDVTAAAGMDLAQMAAMAEATVKAGGHASAGMELRKIPVEAGEPLRLEIMAFLDAVRTRNQPVVTVEDGRAALALALEINASIAAHARRTGL